HFRFAKVLFNNICCMHPRVVLLKNEFRRIELVIITRGKNIIPQYLDIEFRIEPFWKPTGIAYTMVRYTTPKHHIAYTPLLCFLRSLWTRMHCFRPHMQELLSQGLDPPTRRFIREHNVLPVFCRPL